MTPPVLSKRHTSPFFYPIFPLRKIYRKAQFYIYSHDFGRLQRTDLPGRFLPPEIALYDEEFPHCSGIDMSGFLLYFSNVATAALDAEGAK